MPGDLEWSGDDKELGARSSGSGVHWMKKDQDGNIPDEAAVKTMPYGDNDDFPPYTIKRLNQEAELQSNSIVLDAKALCTSGASSSAQLKTAHDHTSNILPHGNIERFRFRYRGMQRYLPEAFLRRAPFSFARACVTMQTKGYLDEFSHKRALWKGFNNVALC